VKYVLADTPGVLRFDVPAAPVLMPVDDGNLHRGIGYGGYLGAGLVLAVAVLLTWQLRRPAAASSVPSEESAGPAAG
jgi:hypothetical protein